jgi:hypothetical protein
MISKIKLLAYAKGWRVRRAISILENRIKQYVHCDNTVEKALIKSEFHK